MIFRLTLAGGKCASAYGNHATSRIEDLNIDHCNGSPDFYWRRQGDQECAGGHSEVINSQVDCRNAVPYMGCNHSMTRQVGERRENAAVHFGSVWGSLEFIAKGELDFH
jgi:hypothetical protein